MTAHSPSSGIMAPLQERSLATMNRILDATEELCQENRLEDVTLTDILDQSGVSVGAFYARFKNRQALVAHIYDRYDRRQTEGVGRVLDPARWEGRSLRQRVELLSRYSVLLYRKRSGLLRTVALEARIHPENVTLNQRKHRTALYERLAELLLACRGEISHPDPEHAVRFGLLMAASVFREKILFAGAPHASAVQASDRDLAREVSRALMAYLTR